MPGRVIHNDWRFDNVVLDPDDLSRIKAVLDWELATVGDPFMDLGSAMAYWVQPDDEEGMQAFRMQPSTAPGMPTRDEFVDEYCRRGRSRAPGLVVLRGLRPVPSGRDRTADLVPLLPRPDVQPGVRKVIID